MKNSTLALKGTDTANKDVTATASFESLNGNVATYAVADFRSLKDGKYAVTPSIDVASKDLSTTYSAIVSTTNVEGFVFENERNSNGDYVDANGNPTSDPAQYNKVGVAGATVTVGGETVKTNSEGYYKLPVNAGQVKVEFTKDGNYFVKEETAQVKRNFSTVQNAELVHVDVAKLQIDGTVVDTKTGSKVNNATAILQKKVDNEWEDIATKDVTTGDYSFGNVSAGDSFGGKNKITLDSELRVVISKDLSATNLDDVYEAKTVDVTLSNKDHKTNVLTELRPIAEIDKFEMDVTWNKDEDKKAELPTSGDSLTFKLVDSNGKDVLVADKTLTVDELKENALKDAIDLVDEKFFDVNTTNVVKPTLPTGKYFLVVSDDVKDANSNEVNAIAVAAIDITEGQNYAGKVEIEKARTLNLTANYSEVVYDDSLTSVRLPNGFGILNSDADNLVQGGSPAADLLVLPELVVTKKVDGVDVELARKPADKAFQYDSTDKSIVSQSVVEKMGLGAYNINVENDYVFGGKATKATEIKTDVKNETISFETASTLDVTLTNKDDDAIEDNALVGATVELLDKSGKVVATTSVIKDEKGKIVTNDKDVAEVTGNDTLGEGETITFKGIKPGDYKVRAKAVDHEQETSKELRVLDVQDKEATVKLEAIKKPVVQGFVKFVDDFADVSAATVMVYRDGKPVTYYDITTTENGHYIFDGNAALTEGVEYEFVVRGDKFETASTTHKVTKGENEPVNFKVTRGGEGKAKLSVTTSDKFALPTTDSTITATDSLFGGSNLWTLSNGKWNEGDTTTGAEKDNGSDGPDFFGAFDFTQGNPGATPAEDDKEWNTTATLSSDDYKLAINFNYGTPAKAVKYASTMTLGDINGTYYGEIEVPVDNKGVVEYVIDGKIEGASIVKADAGPPVVKATEVVVAAFDKNGNLVSNKRVTPTSDGEVAYSLTVPNGQVYSVAVYVDGTFVEAKDVTVQGFNEKANFSVEEAKR